MGGRGGLVGNMTGGDAFLAMVAACLLNVLHVRIRVFQPRPSHICPPGTMWMISSLY
ncbi:uncharacterized protein BDW70DRAFT_140446 [Aspergillus foveolatus]|uniref:uncharacterized protein n=1 Tax=Aspergillus foveolatus TaxID=210207 RepID=UPI003CCD5774